MVQVLGAVKEKICVKLWSGAPAEIHPTEGLRRDMQGRLARPTHVVSAMAPSCESALSVSPYLLQPAKPRPRFFPGDRVILDGAPLATVQKVTWTVTGWSYSLIDGRGESVS
jgi:hypothetical protein